jgi:hypothetical protein
MGGPGSGRRVRWHTKPTSELDSPGPISVVVRPVSGHARSALLLSPLGMQDFSPAHGYYHYEREKSMHPAYPFRMSARDMARFGLLYLYQGRWGAQRLRAGEYVTHLRRHVERWLWLHVVAA